MVVSASPHCQAADRPWLAAACSAVTWHLAMHMPASISCAHGAVIALPCHATQCHAMPCHAMPCRAMPATCMPCYSLPCHAAMPAHAAFMPRHAMCHACRLHAASCHPCYAPAVPCHATAFMVLPCLCPCLRFHGIAHMPCLPPRQVINDEKPNIQTGLTCPVKQCVSVCDLVVMQVQAGQRLAVASPVPFPREGCHLCSVQGAGACQLQGMVHARASSPLVQTLRGTFCWLPLRFANTH